MKQASSQASLKGASAEMNIRDESTAAGLNLSKSSQSLNVLGSGYTVPKRDNYYKVHNAVLFGGEYGTKRPQTGYIYDV